VTVAVQYAILFFAHAIFLIFFDKQHDAVDALDSLNNDMNTGGLIVELSLYCGRDFDKLGALLAEMQTLLQVLLESFYRTLNLISCKRVVRIYHTTVYDAVCQYSVNGVMWVFASAAVMATFGLIMILFRSAYKPTRYIVAGQEKAVDDDYESDSEPESESYEGQRLTTAKTGWENDDKDDESSSEPESWSDEGTRLKSTTTAGRENEGGDDDDESGSELESWSDEGTRPKTTTTASREKKGGDDDESGSEPESWSDEDTRPKTTTTASREKECGDVYGIDSDSESWSDEGTRPKTAVREKEDDESSEFYSSDPGSESGSDEGGRLT